MRIKLIILLLFPLFTKCQAIDQTMPGYLKMIGDILYDASTDRAGFEICNENRIYQYFNFSAGLQYEGEKIALEKIFKENYKTKGVKKENGYIRIRFIVNCKAETDRFRIIASDYNYKEKIFDPSITNQLLTISKSLKGWKTQSNNGNKIDYYQYLIFKIKDGLISEILP